MFFKGSRYEAVAELTHVDGGGREIRHKAIRFVTAPAGPALAEHTVAGGERLDLIAFRYYRDPERFWRICDANRALWPPDLVAPAGRRLLIPPAAERAG